MKKTEDSKREEHVTMRLTHRELHLLEALTEYLERNRSDTIRLLVRAAGETLGISNSAGENTDGKQS